MPDQRSKGMDYALTALIAEYNAMRAASLSRDQNKNVLIHLQLLVILAAIAGLPSIISAKYFVILPLVSLVLSALASSALSQSIQTRRLACYESEVLRPRLLRLLDQASERGVVPDVIGGLWDWQHFHLMGADGSSRMARVIRIGGFGPSTVAHLTSIGILVAFVELRLLPKSIPVHEWILLSTAAGSCLWSVASHLFWYFIDGPRQAKLFREVSAGVKTFFARP